MSKPFLVFMCPKCKNFTSAPVTQKRRRCSYCGHIINISKTSQAVFESGEIAAGAVREFNAARGGDKFHRAVEKSREKLRELLPSEVIDSQRLMETDESPSSAGKMGRLMRLLEAEAKDNPCTLDRLAQLAPKHQLNWQWVEEQINKLSNQGVLIFPKPWTVKLLPTAVEETQMPTTTIDASKEILAFLDRLGGNASVTEIVEHFQNQGVSKSSIEMSLDRLMKRGLLYEPNPGRVSLV
ncbi:MAG: MarR family transcriptional regulator [Candidatus Thorarchaeota archaeon]|nr:MAG: MarR family transcriptional regulator [Candidatus Thorarchaeota archaeon]